MARKLAASSSVTGGDTAEVLQLGEETLDEVTVAVEPPAEAGFPAPVALGRDVGRCAVILDQLSDAVGTYALSASTMVCGPSWLSSVSAICPSCAWSVVRPSLIGSPCASTTAWILVVSPPRERPRQ